MYWLTDLFYSLSYLNFFFLFKLYLPRNQLELWRTVITWIFRRLRSYSNLRWRWRFTPYQLLGALMIHSLRAYLVLNLSTQFLSTVFNIWIQIIFNSLNVWIITLIPNNISFTSNELNSVYRLFVYLSLHL